jgi:hypothetical protein
MKPNYINLMPEGNLLFKNQERKQRLIEDKQKR